MKEAGEQLGTSPQGKGLLWIRQLKISPASKAAGDRTLGLIDSITFDVQIDIPRNPRPAPPSP